MKRIMAWYVQAVGVPIGVPVVLAFLSVFVPVTPAVSAVMPPELLKEQPAERLTLPPVYITQNMSIGRNQTLGERLMALGLPASHVYELLKKIEKKYSLRRLPAGQEIFLSYLDTPKNKAIKELSFYTKDDKFVKLIGTEESYGVDVIDRPLLTEQAVAVGHIEDSLYASAKRAKLPAALVPAFANLFAWELDFTRDIHPGNTFRVVYERILDENGAFLRTGDVLAAEIITKKRVHNAFRMEVDGIVGYYDEDGYNKKRSLLRTPIEFTRISSHFNLKRKHPILGYTRAHKGTDFAAPTGTPIKAAGDGIVERANWYGGYGRYVRIRHFNGFKTAYAHLSRFARGMKAGKKLKQGQTIGYVGTSGRSTGPHLHFEITKNDRHVNPLTVKLPKGNKVPRKLLGKYRTQVASFRQMMDNALQIAQN